MIARQSGITIIAAILAVGCLLPGSASAADPARDYTLRLSEFAFDPLNRVPEFPTGWDQSSTTGPKMHLVQLAGPSTDSNLRSLSNDGLEIIQYIHPYTYIVWGETSARESQRDKGFVRWTGEFAPAYRVQPQWRNLTAQQTEVNVLIYRGADIDNVIQAMTALGAANRGHRVLSKKLVVAKFDIPGNQLQAAASIPGVYSIQKQPTDGGLRNEMTSQINVNNYDAGNVVFPGYQSWLAGVGLDGSGVTLAGVDGGVDQTHLDLVNRMVPCTGGGTCSTTASSHGTHTAGTMVGDGSSGTLDSDGFLRGLGVAPGANLFEQVYSPTFQNPGGMILLMKESYLGGALASGNSWGPAGSPQGYDNDTLQTDLGVRDTDPLTPGDQPLHYVLSIMNGNGGTSSQGSPDEAKNLFTIGSTKARTGGGTPDLNIFDISANSAHGPALDGRHIPHMVAPGCNVESTDNGGGYYQGCGTSFASPQVAGAVAVFIEYYRGLPDYVTDPSAALVKAAFLPVTHDLAGFADADGITLGHPFDSKQGWGRMNLEAVVDPEPFSVRYFDNPVIFDNTGEEWSTTLAAYNPALPVRMMLVWTDAAGHGLGGSTPAWNNDLDLVVELGGNTYLGNNFGVDGYSVTGGSADIMNNTEGVFLPAPTGGLTIRVRASNITSDGLPNSGDGTDQDFALVCYNCALEPTFTLGTGENSLGICAPDDAAYSITVGSILGFTDPVSLSVSGEPAGTTASFSVNPVTPGGASDLTIGNTGSAVAGSYTLQVDGNSGTIARSLNLNLELNTSVPGPATLLAPADSATGVSRAPLLEWAAAVQVTEYQVEIATDSGFSNIIYNTLETTTTHAVESALEKLTTYYWRIGTSNMCGQGSYSATFSFTTLDTPPILLVDDDDNSPDVRDYYLDVLDGLGLSYDVWDTVNSDDEPTATELAIYQQVIWFSGDEFSNTAGPGSAGELALAAWLNTGGCMLLSSQDYYYDRSLTSFMQTHLGVASVANDQAQASVTGDGIFGGLGPYTMTFPYSNYTDMVTQDSTAQIAFAGNESTIAISKDTGVYRTSFWTFGLETIADLADRTAAYSVFNNWCDTLATDDNDDDTVANGSDCAPLDPDFWSAPSPALDLTISKAALDNIGWSTPLNHGASTAPLFDLLRAAGPTGFLIADCQVSGSSASVATDTDSPVSGSGFYYLVRALNDCGGTTGTGTSDLPRPATSCP